MNKTLRTTIIIVAVLVVAGGLLGTGFFIGRAAFGWTSFHNPGMMGFFNSNDQDSRYGYSMMDNFSGQGMMGGRNYYQEDGEQCNYGPGMMNHRGSNQNQGEQCPYGPDMMDDFAGSGMMGGGMMGNGMMNGYGFATDAEPLSTQESLDAVETYLAELGNDDLAVAEIMVFEYNSYAIVKEESTGTGAFELLIDPATKNVFPEYGPNMMWNLKYEMMPGNGGYGMGRMMGGFGATDASTEMTVTPDQAVEVAQTYLDTYFTQANLTVDEHADPFYGYYTLHVNRDGQTVGMLSVNGFTGQVFPHTWHGKLLEMGGE